MVFSIPLPAPRPVGASRAARRPAAVSEFIGGPENRLARVAADNALLPVTSNQAFNPLVICGPPGCGKSHLARGLASAWLQQYPGDAVRIISVGDPDFPPKVEQLQRNGLLVIEDLQKIRNSKSLLRRLLLLIDRWLDAGGKLLVTSTAAPATLPHLTGMIRSRLAAGLVLNLVTPEYETRLSILRAYANSRQLAVTDRAAQRLARSCSASVAQLVDAVEHFSSVRGANGRADPIGESMAREYLAQPNSTTGPTINRIVSLVARYYGLKAVDLKGRNRRQAVATARCVAMYLAWRHSKQTLLRIGTYLGGRDHTTVLHGCRKIEKMLNSEVAVQQAIAQLEAALSSNQQKTVFRLDTVKRKTC